MKNMRWIFMSAALIAGASVWAGAQSRPYGSWHSWQQQDRDRDRDYGRDRDGDNGRGNSAAYQDGFRQGQWDAQHNNRSRSKNRRWSNDADRRAYEAGYNRGYQSAIGSRGNGGYGNGAYGRGGYGNGQYGNGGYGNSGVNSAGQIGYQDGVNDGANDRQTGHSFRPTEGDNYKNADRGYTSSVGSKDQYKQLYRQGYQQGYQIGYYRNASGGYRR